MRPCLLKTTKKVTSISPTILHATESHPPSRPARPRSRICRINHIPSVSSPTLLHLSEPVPGVPCSVKLQTITVPTTATRLGQKSSRAGLTPFRIYDLESRGTALCPHFGRYHCSLSRLH